MTEDQDPIEQAIEHAFAGSSHLQAEQLYVTGFCPIFLRHLLNNLCSGGEVTYLEIGCLRGASMICSAYGNTVTPIGGDNFSQFRGLSGRRDNYTEMLRNLKDHGVDNATIHRTAFQDLPIGLLPASVDVLYLDADHGEEPTYDAAMKFIPLLYGDGGILIQDDIQAIEVARGFDRALADLSITERPRILRRRGNSKVTDGYDGAVGVMDFEARG